MPEYRYTGVNVSGKPIQGIVFSPDSKTVKNKIGKIVKTKGIRITEIQKKDVFVYKIQKGTQKPIHGEQKAFSKEELHNALVKMGYRVHHIRKKWVDIKLGVPTKDLVLFIRICADLLKEKFPYDEILTLVGNDTENRRLREAIKDIQTDLKSGQDGQAVYGKHTDVFGRFTSHMLAVASTSGNMAAIYESTAKFLERDADIKSKLRSLLVMPAAVMFAMGGAVMFYVMYIFPKLTDLLVKQKIEIPPMTKATMDLSHFLQNYYLMILLGLGIPIVLLVNWVRTDKGRYLLDKTLLRMPIIGSLLQKTSIEVFARVFSVLYSSSGENITAIRIAAESCRNRYIEKQITGIVIPRMLKDGRSFVECLGRTNCFPLNAVSRLKSGEESGTMKESARQIADYYEKESTHKMERMVDTVNILISIVVTLMIVGLTLISSEIGFVSPPSPLTQ
ncbi:MAG: type II secretion system F family protein [bacterium]